MKLNKQSSQKFTFFLDSVTNHHTVRAGASLQQGAGVDREADYGLQGAVGGRREVQAGEMLFLCYLGLCEGGEEFVGQEW